MMSQSSRPPTQPSRPSCPSIHDTPAQWLPRLRSWILGDRALQLGEIGRRHTLISEELLQPRDVTSLQLLGVLDRTRAADRNVLRPAHDVGAEDLRDSLLG